MGFEPTHIGTTITLRDNIKRKNRYFSPFRNIIYHFINILWLHIGYMDFNKSPYMEDRKSKKNENYLTIYNYYEINAARLCNSFLLYPQRTVIVNMSSK